MPLDLALQSHEICGALEELRSHSLVFSGASDRVPSLSPRVSSTTRDPQGPAPPVSLAFLPHVETRAAPHALLGLYGPRPRSSPRLRRPPARHRRLLPVAHPAWPLRHPHTRARNRRLPSRRVLRVLRAGRQHARARARVRQRQRARRAHVRLRHICALLACAPVPRLGAAAPARFLRGSRRWAGGRPGGAHGAPSSAQPARLAVRRHPVEERHRGPHDRRRALRAGVREAMGGGAAGGAVRRGVRGREPGDLRAVAQHRADMEVV
ncbi:hypothetical protein BD311DRAFT_843880, partial [Dichomitus squalens]